MGDKAGLEAELRGVEAVLDKLESEYDKGMIDLGRYTRLRAEHETRKAELEQALATLPERLPVEEPQYDVFLSYNKDNQAQVEIIANRLCDEEGLRIFLDCWNLVPGIPWQRAVQDALEQSETVAVFIGPSGVSAWHNEELRDVLSYALRRRDDYRVIPVLLPGATEAMLSFLLPYYYGPAGVDFGPGLDDNVAFARLVAGIRGQPTEQVAAFVLPDEPAPYPGLLPFKEQRADFFFGRTAEREELLARVRENPFVAVVGASGSGKSSLVLAGLLPALDKGWRALTLVPGARPLRALADQLATLAPPEGRLRLADELEARLTERTDGLSTALSTHLAALPGVATVLIVVDQFEEVFTQVVGSQEEAQQLQQQFIANLADVVNTFDGRLRVLLTLRSDFLPRCFDFRDLHDLLEGNQLWLRNMDEESLREAVVEPARIVGAWFEKGLVRRLLDDVRRQPAALPLLQFALAQLWQQRSGVWLTHAAYDDIGGVGGAIDQRADKVYARLDETQKRLARNLFVRLVALGDEDTTDTRRRVRREELNLVGTSPEDVEALMTILSRGDVRLIVADAGTLELAHEALIEQWARLGDWLQKDRATLLLQQRLTQAAQEWERCGRDEAYLYRGNRLAQVRSWTETRSPELSMLERDFILASVAAWRSERAILRQRQVLRFAVVGLLILVGIAFVLLARMSSGGKGLRDSTQVWEPLGTLDVQVNTIAAASKVPETLFVGTEDGKIFKWDDTGMRWTLVLSTSGMIQRVTSSPHVSGTLYAGVLSITDEEVKGKISRSSDDGEHWTIPTAVLDALDVTELVVDPLVSGTLYVCDGEHPYIYQSTDGGTSWFTITVAPKDQAIVTLAVDVIDEAELVLYAGSADETDRGHLWRNIGREANWQNLSLNPPLTKGVEKIAVSYIDARTLYALTSDSLYRVEITGTRGQVQTLSTSEEDGWEYGWELVVDPRSPGVIFFSTFTRVYIVQDLQDGTPLREQIAPVGGFDAGLAGPWLVVSNREPYFLYVGTQKGIFGWLPSNQVATWFD